MKERRRGYLLIEMLTVIVMITVGGSLITLGLAAIFKSQQRVAAADNRYAIMDDFLRSFSSDVRAATLATVREGSETSPQQILVIGEAPRELVYELFEDHITRKVTNGGHQEKMWRAISAKVTVETVEASNSATLVSVTVLWHRSDAQDPEPHRRFDLTLRCAGELDHDEE